MASARARSARSSECPATAPPWSACSTSRHARCSASSSPTAWSCSRALPAPRRAHLDRLVAALWPPRTATRHAYARALAQRNALLAGIRAGRASRSTLPTWDGELARHAIALREDRERVVELLHEPFAARATQLGLSGEAADALPPALARHRRRGVCRRAARAPARRARARLWRPRPPPRRAGVRCATVASCAAMARRASCASPCWRCCWPSAPCWPSAAGAPRCCCSTT